ncbi:MAG: NAD(+)/NADH kinase [bacterium]
MKSVGLIYKRNHDQAAAAAKRAALWLAERDVQAVLTAGQQATLGVGQAVDASELGRETEFLVTLGGDGTLLHAAGVTRNCPVPILGINMGRLGFLTPFSEEELEAALEAALEGRLAIQQRMRLQVTLSRDDSEEVVGIAANDAVISQGALARLLELEARESGRLITTYRADGLIVCTPTGSTAYNLAAGGPLLMPGLAALCVTPICPHTLTNRSLVLPAECEITVQVGEAGEEPYLTIDGQRGYGLKAGDVIRIARASRSLPLYQAPDRDIFELMRSKLSWSGSAG